MLRSLVVGCLALLAVGAGPDADPPTVYPPNDFVEYWSAAPDALHDRIVFARDGDGWRRTRLAP